MRADTFQDTQNHDTFTLWATSDAHVVREALAESPDPRAVPRESMKIAIEQADGPDGFGTLCWCGAAVGGTDVLPGVRL